MNIKITFRDGTTREFLHEGRPGGSYTKHLRYESGMVIVKDEWDVEIAFPQELVQEVESNPGRRY